MVEEGNGSKNDWIGCLCLPVAQEGRLAGIVSIGDVVKARIEQVEREAEEMRAYIATA